MLSAKKRMDVVSAFKDVGTYRGAAEICGVDPKTVKRVVLAHEAGELEEGRRGRRPVAKNTDVVGRSSFGESEVRKNPSFTLIVDHRGFEVGNFWPAGQYVGCDGLEMVDISNHKMDEEVVGPGDVEDPGRFRKVSCMSPEGADGVSGVMAKSDRDDGLETDSKGLWVDVGAITADNS